MHDIPAEAAWEADRTGLASPPHRRLCSAGDGRAVGTRQRLSGRMTMTEAIRWKHGARCAVTLSFDVDGETPWIYRDKALADRPLHMAMGAYGPKTGVPRILKLLDRYDIKAGFFIPGWIIERYPDLCQDIVRRGHEVGHHGYLHEKPFYLGSREEERAPRQERRHLRASAWREAPGISGPVGRPEPAHHGAPEKARLRLPQQHDGRRPALSPRDRSWR